MHMNAENKLFLTCKTNNFFKKSLFLFKCDKIFQAAILQNFHSDFELLMFRTVLKNLYNKTSFRATDLNYEINLFRFLIFSYANNSNHKRRPKEGCPQSADCAVPGSKPLRGVLFTTGGDDCPTQAGKTT
jgi:hypothetical protein